MKSFWNKTTITISILAIIFPLILIYVNFINATKDLGISNAITLCALFITILSTLYSNYKSDERTNNQIKVSQEQFNQQLEQNEKNLKQQLLFNKKQEIYLRLYNKLNEYWGFLDKERIDEYIYLFGEPPEVYISYKTFSNIHKLILNIKYSPEFNLMTVNIQNEINKFMNYTAKNLENYEYYKENDKREYWIGIEILSNLYPLLKTEIGLNKQN